MRKLLTVSELGVLFSALGMSAVIQFFEALYT